MVFISWCFAVSEMFVLLVALKISTKRASFVGFVGWLNSLTTRYKLQIQYQNEFQTFKPHTNAHRHKTRTQKTSSILIKHFCADASGDVRHLTDFSKLEKVEQAFYVESVAAWFSLTLSSVAKLCIHVPKYVLFADWKCEQNKFDHVLQVVLRPSEHWVLHQWYRHYLQFFSCINGYPCSNTVL